jgi:hypothetical protein
MEAQAVELERRLREWEVREAERSARLAAFRDELKAAAEEKAAHAAERLDAALKRDAATMLAKREAFDKRIADAEKE